MTLRGRQSKRRRARVDDRDPFEVWRSHVQSETDPDRREAIIEAGRDHGWVGPNGEVLDPSMSPEQRAHATMNSAIRRASAGRQVL